MSIETTPDARPAPPAAPDAPPFGCVLVANRGEIACRIIRTLARLGIRSVAVYSDADRDAPHVRLADAAVRIGPAAAARSYLDADALIAAARSSGAEAVHPGYGFLSENPAFARAVAAAGLVFIGPDEHALTVMGDKIRAKEHVARAGVPVTPAVAGAGLDDAALIAGADGLGYPLLIKPSAGGGGKGMIAVHEPAALPEALAAARRQAAAAFGDDALFLERLVPSPRHIEVQVLADAHGGVVHLGERECSLQRRHQKVIEETPSPAVDSAVRARIGEAACAVARSVDYRGAGTVEFIVSDESPGEFFFMEMNTRLQVEHPVTEEVTGIDLVEEQLRIAAGLPLRFAQRDVRSSGHAVEARLYAESPRRGFLPAGGRVLALDLPSGPGVRVDGGIRVGQTIGTDYDPMLAKLVAWAPDRATALARLDEALARLRLLGVEDNAEYLRMLLADDDVRAGRLDTGLIERRLPGLRFGGPERAVLAAAALWSWADRVPAGPADAGPSPSGAAAADRWRAADGWRIDGCVPLRVTVVADAPGTAGEAAAVPSATHTVILRRPRMRAGGIDAEVAVDDEDAASPVRWDPADPDAVAGGGTPDALRILLEHAGAVTAVDLAAEPVDGGERVVWAATDAGTRRLVLPSRAALLRRRLAAAGRTGGAAGGEIRTPMPGTVVAVHARDGERVEAGRPVVTVEAMKMEHRLDAPVAGVLRLLVRPGETVAQDAVLARIEAAGPDAPATDTEGEGRR